MKTTGANNARKNGRGGLPKLLSVYAAKDFELQLRARFLYYLILSINACLIIILLYTSLLNLGPGLKVTDYYLSVLIPLLSTMAVTGISLILLIRGYLIIAGHSLLITIISSAWIVMIVDTHEMIRRLDTIVFVLAGLSMLPLVINRNKNVIFIYIFSNILFLLFFFVVFKKDIGIDEATVYEYISDSGIAILFIGIVSFNIFRINRLSHEKAMSDLNEKLDFERALNESEGRYRALMDSMNEVIIVADNNHIVNYVNKKFTEKLGYTAEEIIGKVGYKILQSPEDQKIVEKANDDRINDRNTVYELTFRAKDGRKIDFLVSGAPYRDFSGKTVGSVGSLMDITERKKTEKALRESQQQFETLAKMSPVGIFRANADGFTTYVNPKWCEISGLGPEEAYGFGWLKAVHPDDIDYAINRWDTDIKRKTKSVAEYRFLRPDGSVSWVLGDAVPEVVDGEFRGFIGTITSITEMVEAQKELERYRNQLEQLVYERTLDLEAANQKLKTTNIKLDHQRQELQIAYDDLQEAQNKLIQAEKMASLGVLAAGIAHEINNPLNFINGGAIALEDYLRQNLKDGSEEVEPLLEAIRTGVDRAAEIVKSLNLYSRRDDLPNTECNIHSIIDNCLVMLNNEIKYKAKVTRRYTGEKVMVKGNEGRLHQVFLNILTNAIQAIDNEGLIEIVTLVKAHKGVVVISDNGCGISSDLIPRITDPFFTTKDPGKGTGLGLSITYNILKDYGGTIAFESEPGEGTRVIITLPLARP